MTAATPDPEPDWPVWLAREDVSPDAKVLQLAQYVRCHGKLPDGCDFLWSETSRLAGLGRGATAVLPQLIPRLDAGQLARLLSGVPEAHLRPMFAGLVVAASSETTLVPVLSKFIVALEEDQLILLVRNLGRLSGLYPAGEGELGRRLLAMLRELAARPDRFWGRLAALRAAARFLPHGHERVGAWRQFQDAFESCVAAARTRRGTRTASEAEADVRQMGAALARAMPADWYPDDAQAGGKHRLLDALLAQAALSHAALPDNFAELLDEGLANRLRDRHQCLRLWDGHEEPSQADAGAAALSAGGTRSVPATEEPPAGDTGAASAVAPPAESSQAQLPPPDDRMLFHFLDAPAGGGPAVSNSPPLPDRWRAMPAEERRRWLCRALTAYLQTCSRRGAALVLLVEPEVSPLLAYGIARLLPQPWRFRLRCSAAGAGLAGGPATGDPSDAAERVLDTWAAPGASFPATEGYAKLIWDDRLLLPDQAGAARRAARIDRWLQPWEQTRVEGLAQLQELARGEVAVRRMLAGAYDESQMAWSKSRLAREHVRRRIRQCLTGHPNPALMEGAARSPAVFRLVMDVALEAGDEIGCRAAVRSLVERVASLDSLEEALGPGPAARAFKLHALRHHVSTYQRLPHDCGWLWRERPPAGQDAQQPLLFDVLSSSRVTWDVIRASLDAVPAEGLGLLFCGVLVTQTTGPAKSEVLANLAARPEFDLIELLAHFGTDLWIHREDVQDVLAVRIEQMLDRLHAFPERFPSLAAVLETASRLCEGGERHEDLRARIKAW